MFFIKEHLWMSASDEASLKKKFPESKPSSKLASKTKCYHNCGCCDDYRTFEQLRRMLQINILNPNRLLLQEMYVTIKILK